MYANLAPVKCPDPKCHRTLYERRVGWGGDPIVIDCKKCGRRIEVTAVSARFIDK